MRINNDASSVLMSERKKAETRELEVFESRFKNLVDKKDKQGLEEAARDFEELFVGIVMKTMRKTIPKGSTEASFQRDIFEGMLDEAYAKEIAKSDGFGLAKMIVDSFSVYMKDDVEEKDKVGFDQKI